MISIVVPVYNVENYLDICLDSIIAQSYPNWEAICINDGSTDTSLEILNQYSKLDSRIKVFSKQNGGLSDARNFGIKKVSGNYTMFVDSDDYISPLMLERLYNNIAKCNSDFNFCGTYKLNNITQEISTWNLFNFDSFLNTLSAPFFNENDLPSEYMFNLPMMAWGKLYKTDFIKNMSFPKGKIFEDNPFFAECYLRANKISFDLEPLYYYRVNRQDSIIENNKDKYLDIFYIAQQVKNSILKSKKWEKYKTDYYLYFLQAFFIRAINTNNETKEQMFNNLQTELNKINFKKLDKKKLNENKLFSMIYSVRKMNYLQFSQLKQRKGGK